MSTITVSATYSNGVLTVNPETINVASDSTTSIVISLPGSGDATFTGITWGSNGVPPGLTTSGMNTTQLTLGETNDNSGSNESYPFTLTASDGTSSGSHDPTIVNEGTGAEGIGAAQQMKAA